jgi:hypothetical protein
MHTLLELSSFLAGCVSWFHKNIHDSVAFSLFVALGIVQLVVAIDSAFLAILALPCQVPRARRTRHQWLFGCCALLLLSLTLFIGYLNDKSQFEAALQVKEARDEQAKVQDKLDRSLGNEGEARAYLGQMREEVNKDGRLTSTQLIQFNSRFDKIDQRLSSSLSQPSSFPSSSVQTGPIYPPINNPPYQQKRLDQLTTSEIQFKLDTLAHQIQVIENQSRERRTMWFHGQPVSQMNLQAPLGSYRDKEIADYYKSLADQYLLQTLPQIEALRSEAAKRLHWSASQIDEDEERFKQLNLAVTSVQLPPANLSQLGIYRTSDFNNIEAYLRNLNAQLSGH